MYGTNCQNMGYRFALGTDSHKSKDFLTNPICILYIIVVFICCSM